MKYLLGVDVGTQGSKGVITDHSCDIIVSEYCPHGVTHPGPGMAEHNAMEIWQRELGIICRGLLSRSGIDPGDISAVGCSALSPCMLPLDKNGVPLRNAILYAIDTRSGAEAFELNELFGFAKNGVSNRPIISVQSVGTRILWYKKNEPYLFKQTKMFATASTWLTYCLTGKFALGYCDAYGYAPMFDAENKCWDEDICRAIGISASQLPELYPAYQVIGEITADAAKLTNLKEGTPVITGTGDFAAELISTGATDGDTCLVYGSTLLVESVTSKPVFDEKLALAYHPMDGLYINGGTTSTSASITKWFRDQFGYEELVAEKNTRVNAYGALDRLAANIIPGSEGLILLPYFAGERTPVYDEKARGMLFGLSLRHTKAHVYKSVLEGIAYSCKHNIETMINAGLKIDSLLSTGGGVKSKTWVQIMSDVTGRKQLCLPEVSGSPGGCAFLAGYGVGVYKDMQPLLDQRIKGSRVVLPDINKTQIYQQYYEIYRELYKNTKEQMHKISEIRAYDG